MRLHCEPWIDQVLQAGPMHKWSIVINGLRFYVPDLPDNEAPTAYEWYERIAGDKTIAEVPDDKEGLYVLTPDGEHELRSLDLKPLLQVEADLKRVRRENC